MVVFSGVDRITSSGGNSGHGCVVRLASLGISFGEAAVPVEGRRSFGFGRGSVQRIEVGGACSLQQPEATSVLLKGSSGFSPSACHFLQARPTTDSGGQGAQSRMDTGVTGEAPFVGAVARRLSRSSLVVHHGTAREGCTCESPALGDEQQASLVRFPPLLFSGMSLHKEAGEPGFKGRSTWNTRIHAWGHRRRSTCKACEERGWRPKLNHL